MNHLLPLKICKEKKPCSVKAICAWSERAEPSQFFPTTEFWLKIGVPRIPLPIYKEYHILFNLFIPKLKLQYSLPVKLKCNYLCSIKSKKNYQQSKEPSE